MSKARTKASAAVAVCILSMSASGSLQAETKIPLRERIEVLQRSYPDLIYSITNNILRLMDNRTVVISDGREKMHLEMLREADIEDQLSQIYPIGKCYKTRQPGFNPGLIRSMPFFHSAYGANQHQAKRTMSTIDWFGTPVRFSNRNGAADALRRVRNDLMQLPANIQNALKNPARTFDWAEVPDTEQLSVHAFGIAIDLNPALRNHWRTRAGARRRKIGGYRNRIPPSIVAIFERHGFIWGGKWHRFNTTHFEYRPAMIALARLAEKRGCEKEKMVSGK